MQSYPVPFNEPARLDALAALGATADPGADDPVLDAATGLARALLGTQSALVSLVEKDRQVFAARLDFPVAETPRELSICAHVVAREAPLAVADTLADPVFHDHPVVVGPPHVRSYFGAPIRLSSGLVVGSLCGLGTAPHPGLPPDALGKLAALADLVAAVLEERAVQGGRAEALQSAAERAQEEFLALVGHELRTPLNGIVGAAELVEPMTGSEAMLDALRGSANLMERLVEQLVGFADLRAGRMLPREVECDLGDLLDLVAICLMPRLAARLRPAPVSEVEPGLCVRGDPDMLHLAIECLASNALVHGGGAVRLSAARSGEGVAVTVEDEGLGIDADRRAEVQRAFAVGEPVTTRHAEGLGLGLPLTQRLVERHGGELTLEGGHDAPFRAVLSLPRWRVAA
jgi:signal transduction histidine kinase